MSRSPFLESTPPELPADFDFDRVEGMLLGLAIGDALGNTTEGLLPHERAARWGEITGYLPNHKADSACVGLPSDDSQMAFWTLEQLNADGGLAPERLARRLSCQQIYGIGHAVKEFLGRFKDEGMAWDRAGVNSAGNGALMRIAPVLVPHLASPSSALWADAALASMVTHNERASNACCVAFVAILWDLLRMERPPTPGWWLRRFVEVARPLEGDNKLRPRFGPLEGRFQGSLSAFVSQYVEQALREGKSVIEAGHIWGSGAYLLETVPSVLYILERHSADARQAILRAVNDTKDNDTIAAIVGAAVGALHGKGAFDRAWVEQLSGRTAEHDDGRIFELICVAKEIFLRARALRTSTPAVP